MAEELLRRKMPSFCEAEREFLLRQNQSNNIEFLLLKINLSVQLLLLLR